jgi:16S rRNA U516 pseudouridylate synthase RsuA-like enzyme
MSLLGRPCRCEGSNANCAWCFGTGVRDKPAGSGPRTRANPRPTNKAKPTQEDAAKSLVKQPTASSKTSATTRTCPECGRLVKVDLWLTHKQKHLRIAKRARKSKSKLKFGVEVVRVQPAERPRAVAISPVGTNAQPSVVIVCHKPLGVSTEQCRLALSRPFPGLVAITALAKTASGLLVLTNRQYLASWLLKPDAGITRVYWIAVNGQVPADIARRIAVLDDVDPDLRKTDVGIIRAGPKGSELIVVLPGEKRGITPLMAALGHEVQQIRRIGLAGLKLKGLSSNRWRVCSLPELREAFRDIPGWREVRHRFWPGVPLDSRLDRRSTSKSQRKAKPARHHPDRQEKESHRPENETPARKVGKHKGFNQLGQYFAEIFRPSDPLDATKGTHIFRETGRFGSHPIHDRFDDDSEA